MILTGKGGVGKSFVAPVLAQFLGDETFCADTDPVNATFASYKKIGAKHFNIRSIDSENNVDKSMFDQLMETILEHEGDTVIDNGSTSFLPLMAYMLENDVIDILREAGKNIIIHAVLVGGRGLGETMSSLEALLKSHAAPVVVWENEYFGKVERDGVKFIDTKIFKEHQNRILGVVKLAKYDSDTYKKDVETMTSNLLTFDEVMLSPLFFTFNRHRIQKVKTAIYSQLGQIEFDYA